MKLVMAGAVGYETSRPLSLAQTRDERASYLFSGPPSFLTIFLKENIVPKISFASSSALKALTCGLPSGTPFSWGPLDIGRGVHFFLYMHSATGN